MFPSSKADLNLLTNPLPNPTSTSNPINPNLPSPAQTPSTSALLSPPLFNPLQYDPNLESPPFLQPSPEPSPPFLIPSPSEDPFMKSVEIMTRDRYAGALTKKKEFEQEKAGGVGTDGNEADANGEPRRGSWQSGTDASSSSTAEEMGPDSPSDVLIGIQRVAGDSPDVHSSSMESPTGDGLLSARYGMHRQGKDVAAAATATGGAGNSKTFGFGRGADPHVHDGENDASPLSPTSIPVSSPPTQSSSKPFPPTQLDHNDSGDSSSLTGSGSTARARFKSGSGIGTTAATSAGTTYVPRPGLVHQHSASSTGSDATMAPSSSSISPVKTGLARGLATLGKISQAASNAAGLGAGLTSAFGGSGGSDTFGGVTHDSELTPRAEVPPNGKLTMPTFANQSSSPSGSRNSLGSSPGASSSPRVMTNTNSPPLIDAKEWQADVEDEGVMAGMNSRIRKEGNETSSGSATNSRNGTIKRTRSKGKARASLKVDGEGDGPSPVEGGERATSPAKKGWRTMGRKTPKKEVPGDSYFPDLMALKRGRQERDAEKAKKKLEALNKRANELGVSAFATSPRTAQFLAGSHISRNNSSRSKSSVDTADSEENSGTDEGGDTPWPSSSRHGDTPLGLEHRSPKGLAQPFRGRMSSLSSMGSIEETLDDERAKSQERRGSATSSSGQEAVGMPEGEMGYAISDPLSPPPGYPLSSPSISSSGGEFWRRSSTASTPSSDSDSAPSLGRPAMYKDSPTFPLSKGQSMDSYNTSAANSPYGQYFGSRNAQDDPEKMSRNLQSGVHSSAVSLSNISIASKDSSSSGSKSPDSTFDRLHRPNIEFEDGSMSPFEGKIEIETSPEKYLIAVEMAGFSLENITIAVKSATRSASHSSTGSMGGSGSRMHKGSDAASVRSVSSAKSSGSSGGGKDGSAGHSNSNSPETVAEGKVLHLIADRWEDAAHFERRITFGQDADFSHGVKAKFDGKTLQIEVARRPRRPTSRAFSEQGNPLPSAQSPRYPSMPRQSFSSGTQAKMMTQRNHTAAI